MELTIEQALQHGIAAHKEGKLQDASSYIFESVDEEATTDPERGNSLNLAGTYITSKEFLWWGRNFSIEYAKFSGGFLKNEQLIIKDGDISWVSSGSNYAIRRDVEAIVANDGVFLNLHTRNVMQITVDPTAYDLKLIVSQKFIAELRSGEIPVEVSDLNGDGTLDTKFEPQGSVSYYRILNFNYFEDQIDIVGQGSGGLIVNIL